jgi:periplasmic protein TonB
VNGSRAAFAVVSSLLVHAGLALAVRFRPMLSREQPELRRLEVRVVELPPEPKPLPETAPTPPEPARVEQVAPKPKPTPPKPAEPPPPRSAEVEAPPVNEPEPPPDVPAPLALLDSSIPAVANGLATSTASDVRGGISGGARAPARTLPPASALAAPAFAPLADLSRKPRPPSLDALLRQHYPERLRRLGVDGQAMVRAYVTARGHVARVDVVSESAAGFADACKRTLLGSEWTEPLDRNGNRVATQLTYRCRFQIER